MKVQVKNESAMIMVTRDEFVKLAERFNADGRAEECMYDIDEIKANFPEVKIITEDNIGLTEDGYLIDEEDFYDIIREFGEENKEIEVNI